MEKAIKKSSIIFYCVMAGLMVISSSYAGSQYSGYLYFTKGNDLWVKDLSTDVTTRLTRLEAAIGTGSLANAFISSDGTKIVFSYKANTATETMLYVINPDGSGLENLSASLGLLSQTKNQVSGIYSPDMTKIAFVAEMRNPGPVSGAQLWLKELTGAKRLFQLTLMNGDCSDPQFLDDTHIIFKHKFGYLEDYYLISTSGSDLTNLTNNITSEPYFPRLGRPMLNQNKSAIYFAKQEQNPSDYSNWKICRYDIQSSSTTDVEARLYFTEHPLNQIDPQPVAITDANGVDTAIVFYGRSPFSQTKMLYFAIIGAENPYTKPVSDSEGAAYPLFYPVKAKPTIYVFTSGSPSQVFLRNASNQTLQLTSTINNNYDPVFDPTGSLIAYAGNGIWVMKADGTNAVQIETSFMARYPAFSPDSNWIAYVVSNDIYARKKDLSGPAIRLTYSPSIEKSDLCFSPSGNAIVYTGSTSSGRQIFSLPVRISATTITVTGSPINLTQYPGSENYHPSFSPDGKKIIFISTRDGAANIYVMNPDGSGQYMFFNRPGATYPQFSPWNENNKIAFIDGGKLSIADTDSGDVVAVSPEIRPSGKFSWARGDSYRVSISREFIYNRVDSNIPYYYQLRISINRVNPPSSFIITEHLPSVSKGASADWKITGAWFNNIPISPLTSSGNTTGTVKWIVSNSIGSIFPLTDGILRLKIEFVGSPSSGAWNFVNGSVIDSSTQTMTKGDSFVNYGIPAFPFDFEGNGKISDGELLITIDYWASNSQIKGWPVNLSSWDYWLLKTIDFWAKGGYIYAPTASEPSWNSI
ncbi:MAG: DPP IV N-terminal domain-containing protein [bacterium]|nr:DPP IV N-terminal domain-containing protein [bacterium]